MSVDSSDPEVVIDAAFRRYDAYLVYSSSEDEESQFARWENLELLSHLPFNFVNIDDFFEDSIHTAFLSEQLPFHYCDGSIDIPSTASSFNNLFLSDPNFSSSDSLSGRDRVFHSGSSSPGLDRYSSDLFGSLSDPDFFLETNDFEDFYLGIMFQQQQQAPQGGPNQPPVVPQQQGGAAPPPAQYTCHPALIESGIHNLASCILIAKDK